MHKIEAPLEQLLGFQETQQQQKQKHGLLKHLSKILRKYAAAFCVFYILHLSRPMHIEILITWVRIRTGDIASNTHTVSTILWVKARLQYASLIQTHHYITVLNAHKSGRVQLLSLCLLMNACVCVRTSKRQCDKERKSGYMNACGAVQFVILSVCLMCVSCVHVSWTVDLCVLLCRQSWTSVVTHDRLYCMFNSLWELTEILWHTRVNKPFHSVNI